MSSMPDTVPAPQSAQPLDAAPYRLRVRLLVGSAARLGPGKIDLVEAVARTGSISAAGRAMGMSYRRAWLLLDALNRMFDEPSVIAAAGGAHGGGAVVTPFGLSLVEAYRALEADCTAAAAARFGAFADRLRVGADDGAADQRDEGDGGAA